MATRTQKAAAKGTAEAAKQEKAPKAKPAPKAKAKPASKPAKPSTAKPPKGKAKAAGEPRPAPAPAQKKPSWGERFWHALSGKAEKKAAKAQEHATERAEQRKRELEAEKAREAAAAEEAKRLKHEHELRERRAAEKSKREMQRIAREEDQRLREEAKQARLAAAREARAQAAAEKAEAEARRKAEREAKAEAERAAKAEAERHAEEERQAKAAREAEEEARRKSEAAAKAIREAQEAEERRAEDEARAAAKAAAATAREKEKAAANEAEKAVKAEHKAKAAKPTPATPLEAQADRLAAELASRRSKPVVIEAEDDVPAPTLPGVGRNRAPREGEPAPQELVTAPAPAATMAPEAAAPRGLSLPESFILLALEGEWDERAEKAAPGHFGAALTGSLLLELALRGRLSVQRDRLVLGGTPANDEAVEAAARKLSGLQDLPSLQATANLAKSVRELLVPFKDRLKAKGFIDHAQWRHLGMLPRSQVVLTDADAQERLRNKLRRAIAGGGTPDATTILALGLLDAAGLFETVVPPGAVEYNRKRLNGLLAGRDVMGYQVDKELKGLQEIAVRTILGNVKLMTVRG